MPRWSFLLLSSLLAASGLALRLVEFGRFGFWNDEAWVALATRTDTLRQFWLSAGHTPIGFVLLLRVIPAWLPPELALRAVPLAFGVATMGIAWRLGGRVAGSVGALAVLAAVAFDPLEIAFAKQLKQYTAEAFFAVAALDALQAFAVAPSRSALRWLALSLGVGVVFSNTQLFVAGPVLVVATAVAVGRGHRPLRRVALVILAATGVWIVGWYVGVVAPHVTGSLSVFFANDFIPAGSLYDAARFVVAETAGYLGGVVGPRGWLVGVLTLPAACVVSRSFRPVGILVVLLTIEMVALGLARQVPFGAPRVMLFFYCAMGCALTAALACVCSAMARGRAGTGVALVLAMALVADAARARDWRHITDTPRIEDVGPLIRRVEATRAPEDVVLVYGRTLFVYAYYERAVPVLVPATNTTGFVPILPDPRVRLVDRTSIAAEGDRAFVDARVVWFVGSRLGDDGAALQHSLEQRGTLTSQEVRTDARMLRFERRAGGSR